MEKYNNLINRLKEHGKLCVAFSGGVDSAFLLYAAKQALNNNIIAVTADCAMVPRNEILNTREIAKDFGVEHILIRPNEFSVDGFVENGSQRCYYCKKNTFTYIKNTAEELGYTIVADGSNKDDTNDYRPGMRALSELSVISPLKECGFTKQEIREFSKEFNITVWNKPPNSCLATRIPEGTPIIPSELLIIEQAENYLKEMGVPSCRVRKHERLARIELPKGYSEKVIGNKEVGEYFKSLGFTNITLDINYLTWR